MDDRFDIPEVMPRVIRGLLIALIAATIVPALPLPAQETPDNFRWIDFHSPKDLDVVLWVTKALEAEKWTAIREIGVQYDAALVVTSLRQGPQALVASDTFNVWSVSLTNHLVTALIKGANLRLLDWMLFSIGKPRELGALYDDCNECNSSLFFTSFYYDQRQHGWAARWLRGTQAVPLLTGKAPQGVDVTQVYALMADPNGHELVGTWSHFDYGKQKPAEDYIYQYDVDPWTGLDRTQFLNGKEGEAMKRRLCLGSDVVSGLAKGQDSPLCQQVLKRQPQRKSR
jgi:Putative bacterial sensory transduction regulator